MFLFGSFDLLLLDEIHHLGDDRGSTLEAVVVRMRALSNIFRSSAYPSNVKSMSG